MSNLTGGSGRDHLAAMLAVSGEEARAKLDRAIDRAVTSQIRSVILVREGKDKPRMFTVRPSEGGGHAEISWVGLDVGVSHLQAAHIMELFPLSPAEAEIALLLTRGASLAEAAQARGVGLETVRTQLKAITRKTGVNNQRQLVSLLTQIADALANAQGALVTAQ